MSLRRRQVLSGAAALLATPTFVTAASADAPPLRLSGKPQQGGFLIGRTDPRAEVLLDGQSITTASRNGLFLIGFDRDAGPAATLQVRTASGSADHAIAVSRGHFDVQRINGLPKNQVSPSDPALLERIHAEALRKAAGFASRIDSDDFGDGFALPLSGFRVSGRFGGQRVLNGVPKRPHYGADLAAPIGTPVMAPAGGTVCFAETGLHYEGGLVLIDHGQGAVTAYLHLSKVLVARGEPVTRGQRIALVGKEGRATGPHLCWRMTWRKRHMDPTLLVGAHAPAAT